MESINILEESYFYINRHFNTYKKYFKFLYCSNISDEEVQFVDKIFGKAQAELCTSDKMLNYSIATLYTAVSVLIEIMNRNHISYSLEDIENICPKYADFPQSTMQFPQSTENELEEILFGLLVNGVDLNCRKKSGSERTPDEIIAYMLDIIGYSGSDIINRTIIDPACGTGTFTAQILKRYISEAKPWGNAFILDKLLIQKSIQAFDTKPLNVYITKIVFVVKLIIEKIIHNISEVLDVIKKAPVYCEDFLKTNQHADYIVGNPPYIRLQNLPPAYRDDIKKHYISATGRFDIYVCFIEAASKLLKDNGTFCLITSNKYLTTNYGAGIRKYLTDNIYIKQLIDLFDTKLFKASVLPAILVCQKKEPSSIVDYIGVKSSSEISNTNTKYLSSAELFKFLQNVELPSQHNAILVKSEERLPLEIVRTQTSLPKGGNTWNFSASAEIELMKKIEAKKYCSLGELVDINVGVKSTADDVFVKPMTQEFIEKNKFEKELIFPLIQSFNVKKWKIEWGSCPKDRYILYPHIEKNGNMCAAPLELYPNICSYLHNNKNILASRTYLTESKIRKWYECWVPQRLSKFRQPKLVTRDIVSCNSFAYDTNGMICQGNTFFLTRKERVFPGNCSDLDSSEYYYFLLGFLNTKIMEFYQKMISGCLYSKKYRYTTTNLKRWPIPEVSSDCARKIARLARKITFEQAYTCTEKELDEIAYKLFELSKEEIQVVGNFLKNNT